MKIKPVCFVPPHLGGSPCPGRPAPPLVPPFVPVLPVMPEVKR